MSIFKDTFIPEVQGQLEARQNAIKKRDVTSIKYLNSRNAWIRMSSSVDVNNDGGDLAKKNILQGGISSPQGLRAGVSNSNNNNAAYTQTSQRGLRPMPGINSIDIKSKSAYGSLREVVVKFQCWDIKQLEDLELLYMRPGYTVLIEWGWLPYLKNENTLEYNIIPKDIITKPTTKEDIWKDLFSKSKNTGGNYDAMFGYVKNYSWSARPDGGYDCTTTIISIGEIIESLKVNFAALNYNINDGEKGIISSFLTTDNVTAHKKNILAGIFSEMYNGVLNQSQLTPLNFSQNAPNQTTFSGEVSIDNGKQIKWENYDFFIRKLKTTTPNNDNPSNQLIHSNSNGVQIYITLESLIKILNEKILLKDKSSKLPLTGISVKGRNYLGEGNKDLLCLAHPLQISVDPTICLIGNPSWSNIQKPDFSTDINKGEVLLDEEPIGSYSSENISALKTTINIIIEESAKTIGTDQQRIINSIKNSTNGDINKIKELNRLWYNTRVSGGTSAVGKITLYDYLNNFSTGNFSKEQLNESFGNNLNLIKIIYTDSDDDKSRIAEINRKKTELETVNKKLIAERKQLANAPAGTQYLLNLKSYNPEIPKESDNKNSNLELGIIGNIYINLQFLYSLSLDNNIESQDKKEKQEISLYDFIKNIMSQVSNSIGSINNFDIHVDPVDNIARIIDINYVDETKKLTAYNNAFTLQMHNLESTVRSYKLESQIFPEQSTMIAIGSQVKSSALGMGGSDTMSSFNQNITDRIIPEKIDSYNTEEDLKKLVDDEFNNLKLNLKTIFSYFGNTDPYFNWTPTASFDTSMAAMYKTSLRDLINYFNSISNSSGKNRAIIPTKLSVELDGIGGLVIGHIFKIPDNLLPKGYKGIGNGSKLGHIITGIGHSISNSDWVTNIDAQTIILDEPVGGLIIDYIDLISNSSVLVAEVSNPNSTPSMAPIAPNYSDSSYQKAATYAKRLMTDLGLTNFQAAGIFGNILYESGGSMDPDIIEGGKGYTIENIPEGTIRIGAGWAQWTNDKNAKKGQGRMDRFLFPNGKRKKRSELTDEYNYKYLINDLSKNYSGVLNEIKSSQNVLGASTIFLEKFEIPQNASLQKYFRAAIGDKILNLM
jgi:hypothetical protein